MNQNAIYVVRKELINSHIVPEGFYKNIYDDKIDYFFITVKKRLYHYAKAKEKAIMQKNVIVL